MAGTCQLALDGLMPGKHSLQEQVAGAGSTRCTSLR